MPFIYVAEFTDSHNVETEVECPLGFWVMALGMIASIWCPLIMAHLPELPEICCSEACFVDVCCIHQADEKLMQRGIYGIGGILSVSRELRVLWSAPYLSRLWCVFELAAFRKASPQGKITLSPLFIEAAVACVWILFYVTSTISLISFTYSGESAEYVGIFLNTIPVLVAAHILRVNFLSKHKLLSDLETFDLSTTECSSDSDREFISRAITKWYGSSADFTAFVQDDLRRELVTPILSSSMPLVYYLFIITPKLAANLEILLALLRGGVPGESIAAHAMGALLGYCLCWCPAYLALLVYLSDRFAEPRIASRCGDLLQSLLLGLCVAAVSAAGSFASRECYERGMFPSLGWAGFSLVALALARSRGGPMGPIGAPEWPIQS